MINWRAIGYVFACFAAVFLILAVLTESGFFPTFEAASVSSVAGVWTETFLHSWLIIGALCLVVATVGLFTGYQYYGALKTGVNKQVGISQSCYSACMINRTALGQISLGFGMVFLFASAAIPHPASLPWVLLSVLSFGVGVIWMAAGCVKPVQPPS